MCVCVWVSFSRSFWHDVVDDKMKERNKNTHDVDVNGLVKVDLVDHRRIVDDNVKTTQVAYRFFEDR